MKNLLLLLTLFSTTTFAAADMHMNHQTKMSTMSGSNQAYMHVNHAMHKAMAIDFTGSPDIDFLKGMIPHHQGAVDMAKVQLKHGEDGLLKSFTQRVIRDQKREIKLMKRHLKALEERFSEAGNNGRSTVAFKRINRSMHQHMNIDFTSNADIDFVQGMIPHHQGAVDMARVVLAYGKDPFARRLAYDIINAQEAEISWMRRWQHRLQLMKLF